MCHVPQPLQHPCRVFHTELPGPVSSKIPGFHFPVWLLSEALLGWKLLVPFTSPLLLPGEGWEESWVLAEETPKVPAFYNMCIDLFPAFLMRVKELNPFLCPTTPPHLPGGRSPLLITSITAIIFWLVPCCCFSFDLYLLPMQHQVVCPYQNHVSWISCSFILKSSEDCPLTVGARWLLPSSWT